MDEQKLYFGMKLYELITLLAILVGPLLAVAVTIWSTNRGKNRDQQLQVLRMLIATHHLPSDPAYQVAINLIPIEFRGHKSVMDAHREFILSVQKQPDGVNDISIFKDWGLKSIRLVHEVAKALKYDLRETDLQTVPYSSKGWAERDAILIDSQKAMRDIANLLHVQSRLIASAELTEVERKYLGLPEPKSNAKKN